ncbi:uncharacterized protein TrAtP1_001960 [Trichoderma atroviride]|uniref:uncharacterized protein n=1 Tax=Hypocrea atroviridis TaxID=63577 RepID=UPI0033298F9E|nr:hypothetical protein TrAtP1_001960 [Trichoderma atroviride]
MQGDGVQHESVLVQLLLVLRHPNPVDISLSLLELFFLNFFDSLNTLTRQHLIFQSQLSTSTISNAIMCYYTVGEAVYEDCDPNPSHMVKCIIFEKCLLKEGSRDACMHPGVRKPDAVLKKHVKDGKCPVCPKFTIPIRGSYVKDGLLDVFGGTRCR